MSPRPRLLPWSNPQGQPCYLPSDEAAAGPVAKLADEMEAIQLRTAAELRGHARALLAFPDADAGELRFVANRLLEALCDTLRIAESRGRRLPASSDEGPEAAANAESEGEA